jgi:hypothetical protein
LKTKEKFNKTMIALMMGHADRATTGRYHFMAQLFVAQPSKPGVEVDRDNGCSPSLIAAVVPLWQRSGGLFSLREPFEFAARTQSKGITANRADFRGEGHTGGGYKSPAPWKGRADGNGFSRVR